MPNRRFVLRLFGHLIIVGQKICRCEKIRSVRIFLVDKDTHCAYNLLKQ
jgi:hypothetical protein